MSVHHLELESFYKKICKGKPPKTYLTKLRKYPDQDALVEFLVSKIELYVTLFNSADGSIDSNQEWGIIHSCRILDELNDPRAAFPLVEILDLVKNDYMSWLYNAAIIALIDMGPAAFESAYQKYKRDHHDADLASTWLSVLSSLNVRNDKIYHALIDHLRIDSAEAVNLSSEDYKFPSTKIILPVRQSIKTSNRLSIIPR